MLFKINDAVDSLEAYSVQ